MNRNPSHLTYEEISQYFSCPIHQACIYLHVERHELKKRCLELNIKKWPYRQYQRKKVAPPEGMFGCFTIQDSAIETPKETPRENQIIRRCSDDANIIPDEDSVLNKMSISNLIL
eukprot:gene752-9004_t